MKLKSYRECLKLGKEKVGELLIPAKVNRAKKQAELEMCKLEEQIATKQQALNEECTSDEVSFSKIVEAQDEIASRS